MVHLSVDTANAPIDAVVLSKDANGENKDKQVYSHRIDSDIEHAGIVVIGDGDKLTKSNGFLEIRSGYTRRLYEFPEDFVNCNSWFGKVPEGASFYTLRDEQSFIIFDSWNNWHWTDCRDVLCFDVDAEMQAVIGCYTYNSSRVHQQFFLKHGTHVDLNRHTDNAQAANGLVNVVCRELPLSNLGFNRDDILNNVKTVRLDDPFFKANASRGRLYMALDILPEFGVEGGNRRLFFDTAGMPENVSMVLWNIKEKRYGLKRSPLKLYPYVLATE